MSKLRWKSSLSGQTAERKFLCSLHSYFPRGKTWQNIEIQYHKKEKKKNSRSLLQLKEESDWLQTTLLLKCPETELRVSNYKEAIYLLKGFESWRGNKQPKRACEIQTPQQVKGHPDRGQNSGAQQTLRAKRLCHNL